MQLLTTDQRQRMRQLARRSPAFIGMRIEVHADHVEVLAPDKLEFGFESLSAQLATTPPEDWPDAMDDHFRRGIAAIAGGSPLDAPTETVLEHVRQRIMRADSIPFPLEYPVEIAPGLLPVLAYDEPDTIRIINDDHVRRHGLDRLAEAGIANLCSELPDHYRVMDGDIYVLDGSDYVGSLPLVMSYVTDVVANEPEPPDGVLVAMPARNFMIFHVIRDNAGTRTAVEAIAQVTARHFESLPHQLSPQVFWCLPNRLEAIAHHDRNGLATYPSNQFEAMLRQLS